MLWGRSEFTSFDVRVHVCKHAYDDVCSCLHVCVWVGVYVRVRLNV